MDQTTPQTIDEYIAAFPEHTQEMLQKIRQTVKAAAPEATETIKYNMPTFILHGNLVYFSVFKNHIGFYPAPTGVKEFADDLAIYGRAKSSLGFPLNKPIPFDLITRIVKFRVQENLAKANTKKKR